MTPATFHNSRSANGEYCADEVIELASANDRWLALFCRANRAEQCRLSGVDRPTYAQCEFFAF